MNYGAGCAFQEQVERMGAIVTATLYGSFLLLSLIGLGALLNLTLFPRVKFEWSMRAVLGLSVTIAIGGVLNISGAISKVAIALLLGAGFTVFLLTTASQFRSSRPARNCPADEVLVDRSITLAYSLFFLLTVLVAIAWGVSSNYNVHDDFHAYFVFPQKMLQTGALGYDPFSERRITSGLGGQSFLHALVLAFLPENNLNVLDPGITLVIMAGLVIAEVKRNELGLPRTALIFLLLVFVALPKANITSLGVGVVFFIAYYRLLAIFASEVRSPIASSCLLALCISSLCTLKSTFIPPTVIIFILYFLPHSLNRSEVRGKAKEFLLTSLVVVVLLSPWMVSMHRSCGTYLYPLFGKGYHGSQYGTFLSPTSGLSLADIPLILVKQTFGTPLLLMECLLFALFCRLNVRVLTSQWPLLSMVAGTIMGALVTIIALGGFTPARFVFPFIYPAVILLLIALLRQLYISKSEFSCTFCTSVVPLFCIGMLVGNDYLTTLRRFRELAHDVIVPQCAFFLDDKAEYTALQQAVPVGATILTRLEKPFLLDFKRNIILIVDYPGAQSLPPGMPFFHGGEALGAYLKDKDIRYVAYSYAKEAGFSRKTKEYADRLALSKHPWERTEAQHTFDFQDNLMELSKTKKIIYNDKSMFVLDLFHSANE